MDYIGTTILADNVEQGTWNEFSGPAYNNPPATNYAKAQTANGLTMIVYEQTVSYVGWMLARDVPFTTLPTHFYFEYALTIDDPTTQMCHTIETQVKLTDASSPTWTYSNAAQWLVEQNWLFAINAVSTGVAMPVPPNPYTAVYIALEIIVDTVNHQSRVASFFVNRVQHTLPVLWTPAAQQGWGASQFHPQLLQINNTVVPGGFATHFNHMAFTQ